MTPTLAAINESSIRAVRGFGGRRGWDREQKKEGGSRASAPISASPPADGSGITTEFRRAARQPLAPLRRDELAAPACVRLRIARPVPPLSTRRGGQREGGGGGGLLYREK